MRITFSNVKNYGYGMEFDILLNGEVIGTATNTDDYPTCEYCTTGLELNGQYLDFVHEWGRNASIAKRDIKRELAEVLPRHFPETLDSFTLSDPRVVVARGPYRKGKYCCRIDIYLNGQRVLGGFMESCDFHRLDQQADYQDGPWMGMYVGQDGYHVPEVDDDPYTVAAEVLHAIKEREHDLKTK